MFAAFVVELGLLPSAKLMASTKTRTTRRAAMIFMFELLLVQ